MTNTIENIVNETMINQAASKAGLREAKEGAFIDTNRNMIGAVLGAGLAVGLELCSPTGSKTSALVAGIASAAVIYYAKDLLKNAPQSNVVAASAGVTVAYAGMVAGRIAADYFPGNMDD